MWGQIVPIGGRQRPVGHEGDQSSCSVRRSAKSSVLEKFSVFMCELNGIKRWSRKATKSSLLKNSPPGSVFSVQWAMKTGKDRHCCARGVERPGRNGLHHRPGQGRKNLSLVRQARHMDTRASPVRASRRLSPENCSSGFIQQGAAASVRYRIQPLWRLMPWKGKPPGHAESPEFGACGF